MPQARMQYSFCLGNYAAFILAQAEDTEMYSGLQGIQRNLPHGELIMIPGDMLKNVALSGRRMVNYRSFLVL